MQWLAGAVLVLAGALQPGVARAQIGSARYSSIIIDAGTGTVLEAVNADEPRYPASLTKMMTLYMVFEALRDRRIALDQDVPVSPYAASVEPSKLGLLPATRISVEQAILGLVTKSANDAATALGELLGGDEYRFGQMMTLRARALGMTHTTFRNASGLPDPDQISTARDLAILGRHLVQDFPVEYRYFSTPSFRFRGREIFNHDLMLQRYPGADGIKTGFTSAAGHNLVTSAVRGEVRLVGVVLGAATNLERDIHMASLLDEGFDRMGVPSGTAPPRNGFSLVSAARAAEAPQGSATINPSLRTASARLGAAEASRVPSQPQGQAGRVRWTAQIGTYPNEAAAKQAVIAARRVAGSGEARIEEGGSRGRSSWHASLSGLSEGEARDACAALSRKRMACWAARDGSGQLASR